MTPEEEKAKEIMERMDKWILESGDQYLGTGLEGEKFLSGLIAQALTQEREKADADRRAAEKLVEEVGYIAYPHDEEAKSWRYWSLIKDDSGDNLSQLLAIHCRDMRKALAAYRAAKEGK